MFSKNKKIIILIIGIIVILVLVIVGGLVIYQRLIPKTTPQQPILLPEEESIIKVKQSGAAMALSSECQSKNFISSAANYIIEGKIENVESKWNKEKTNIFTYSKLTIEIYLKGAPFNQKKLEIITDGGCVEDICQGVEDQPIFHQGKKVRIYFEKSNEKFSIVCAQMGVEEVNELKTIRGTCSVNSDCILPTEPYGVNSYGPYDAQCIDSRCKVVVNLLKNCKINSDCNCDAYNPPGRLPKEYVACSCVNRSCHVIVEEIEESAALPNPASVYCLKQGGKLEIRKDEQENEYGVCIFSNGEECEEWAFFRGECKKTEKTNYVPESKPVKSD